MPELPEVESVRRLLETQLVDENIVRVRIADDPIVIEGITAQTLEANLSGRHLKTVRRRGKLLWLGFEGDVQLSLHLGMSGWVHNVGASEGRLVSHGSKPLDDESGTPRFWKLIFHLESGACIAFTDPRRFARIRWLSSREDPFEGLGPDALEDLPEARWLSERLNGRKVPIKSRLLDQSFIAGIGNWLADDILFLAQIAPARPCNTLTESEISRLRSAITQILTKAVAVNADPKQFPAEWLFHRRWATGASRRDQEASGLIFEQVGQRTTVWDPSRQR